MNPQNKEVLDYLLGNPSLTSMEAFSKLGITRLAARIHELRQEGISIDKETIEVKKGTYIAKYFLSSKGNLTQ